MKADITYVKSRIEHFNNLCFDGILPPVPVTVSHARSYLGKMEYKAKRNFFGNISGYSDFHMRISDFHDIPENELDDVIIHEMIHYYLAYCRISDTSPHGPAFRKTMAIINRRFGRNISISHKTTGRIPGNTIKMKTITAISAIAVSAAVISSCSCREVRKDSLPPDIPVMVKALHDRNSVFFADFGNYAKRKAELPIGVFDSGTGGLTVLDKILTLDMFDNNTGNAGNDGIPDFEGESFEYLADQANMPYGVYDACGKADYLRELAVKDALFLLGDRFYENPGQEKAMGRKSPVKIIVIGCNTATAYGLGHIRSLLLQSGTGIKVIGVINAGVNAMLDRLDEVQEEYAVGVLATLGTISSGAYERTIHEEASHRKIPFEVTVVNQGGYGFAESVDSEPDFVDITLNGPRESYKGPRLGNGEADIKPWLLPVYGFNMDEVLFTMDKDGNYTDFQLNSAANYARFNLVSLVERHRLSGRNIPLKAIILGCTHYPFVLETLTATISELRDYTEDGETWPYRDILDKDLCFIDPAVYTAAECYRSLRQEGRLASGKGPMTVDAYISVPSASLDEGCLNESGGLAYDFKFGRECGTEDITTRQVPFSTSNIDGENLKRIERLLPHTYFFIDKYFK